MKPCAVVAEGPDDLAALRTLLREAGAKVDGTIRDARSPLSVGFGGSTLHIWAARSGKSTLAERAIDAAEGTAGVKPEVVAVCFDPDADSQAEEFAFFAHQFEAVRKARASALAADGSVEISGRKVLLRPAPWRLQGAALFARLPNEQNLERILLTGALQCGSIGGLAKWAEDATAALTALVHDHGWKRAFRIWNAALRPKSEAFVDALLQGEEVKASCLAALRASEAWAVVSALLAE
jgi:hypothetical protein